MARSDQNKLLEASGSNQNKLLEASGSNWELFGARSNRTMATDHQLAHGGPKLEATNCHLAHLDSEPLSTSLASVAAAVASDSGGGLYIAPFLPSLVSSSTSLPTIAVPATLFTGPMVFGA